MIGNCENGWSFGQPTFNQRWIMNHCRGWIVLLALTGVLVFLISPSQSAQPEKVDVAGKKLAALVTKFPKVYEKNPDGSRRSLKTKIEMARRISPEEAKIIVVLQGDDDREFFHCFIFMRFYEGHWTTIRGDGLIESSVLFKNGSKNYLHQIMRAIDKASSE